MEDDGTGGQEESGEFHFFFLRKDDDVCTDEWRINLWKGAYEEDRRGFGKNMMVVVYEQACLTCKTTVGVERRVRTGRLEMEHFYMGSFAVSEEKIVRRGKEGVAK